MFMFVYCIDTQWVCHRSTAISSGKQGWVCKSCSDTDTRSHPMFNHSWKLQLVVENQSHPSLVFICYRFARVLLLRINGEWISHPALLLIFPSTHRQIIVVFSQLIYNFSTGCVNSLRNWSITSSTNFILHYSSLLNFYPTLLFVNGSILPANKVDPMLQQYSLIFSSWFAEQTTPMLSFPLMERTSSTLFLGMNFTMYMHLLKR